MRYKLRARKPSIQSTRSARALFKKPLMGAGKQFHVERSKVLAPVNRVVI